MPDGWCLLLNKIYICASPLFSILICSRPYTVWDSRFRKIVQCSIRYKRVMNGQVTNNHPIFIYIKIIVFAKNSITTTN
jgi:hypothetical protein